MEISTLAGAVLEICNSHGIGQKAPLQVADIGILDELQAAQDAAIAIEPPVQENPEPETDIPPDPAISVEARNAYGYTDDAMLPLTKERAMELFERDVPVYLLYGDTSSTTVQRNSRRSSQRRPIYRRCLKPQNRLFRKISRILNRVKSLPFWQCSTNPRRPEAKRPRRQKSAERDLI